MLSYTEYAGGIPVLIHLSPQSLEDATRMPLDACYLLPRTTSLLALLPDLIESFKSFCAVCSRMETQVWFSFGRRRGTESEEEVYLPWLLSAGVVKDYVSAYTGVALRGDPTAQAKSLELVFHMEHSARKNLPSFIDFDDLMNYIKAEVKHLHKGCYTALFGSHKVYSNNRRDLLALAIAASLWLPVQREAQTQPPFQNPDGSPSSLQSSSPPTAEFEGRWHQMDLLDVYHREASRMLKRQRDFYLLRLAFPFIDRETPPKEEGALYSLLKVSSQGSTDEGVTLGLLLWRALLLPCLRWVERANTEDIAKSGKKKKKKADRLLEAFDPLYRTLLPFYTFPPDTTWSFSQVEAGDGLCCQPEWLAWEAAQVKALVAQYEAVSPKDSEDDEDAVVGLPISSPSKEEGGDEEKEGETAAEADRLFFVVQGVLPSLLTPANFLENNLCAPDRCIHVTIRTAK